MTATTRPAAAPSIRVGAPARKEIQALRALAVGLVIAYHLWPGVVRGGFVGVDVFFAVSGFLITGHLLRDIERSGRVHLATFWAARAKRLLPASLLTLAACLAAVFVWVPAGRWSQFLTEIRASALYVQNWRLASDSVDYLAGGNSPSPVQHFWTLSVEEQFYIALPLLLAVCLGLGMRSLPAALRRRRLAVVLGGAVALSAAYSLYLTASAAPVAYFSTATRAWEFGLGGLLACAAGFGPSAGSFSAGSFSAGIRTAMSCAGIRTAMSWVGVAAIAVAGLTYSDATPFPSLTAALPVAGALAVIWAGWCPGRVGTAGWMRLRGVQRLGDISYSAYLWHWPLIVLAPYVWGAPVSGAGRVVILFTSMAIAWLSWRWVENPVRYSPRLLGTARPRVIAAWCAGAMAVVVGLASAGIPVARAALVHEIAQGRALADAHTPCFGAGSFACVNPRLDGILAPDPDVADQDVVARSQCWQSTGSGDLKRCEFGPASGYSARIAVVGDSHMNQHATAFIEAAQQHGWRIEIMGKNGCYLTTAVAVRGSRDLERQCETWKDQVRTYLTSSGPFDAIVVTHAADAQVYTANGVGQRATVTAGLVEDWTALQASGNRVIALVDNPRAVEGVADCVRHHRQDPAACARPRADALIDTETAAAAAQVPGVQVVDLTDQYCDAHTCYPVVGHAVVYHNEGHVTETFSRTLAPALSNRLAAALEQPNPSPAR